MPGGRPTDFKPEYCEQAKKLCLLGAKDKQVADFFEVSESTLNNWKQSHPEFLESLKDGRENADAVIAQSLYHRAKGYSHQAVKILQYEGNPIIVPYIEHYPPDPVAAIFWLKNRQPQMWRDRKDVELTGADGRPLFDANLVLAAAELARQRDSGQIIDVQAVEQKQIVDQKSRKRRNDIFNSLPSSCACK